MESQRKLKIVVNPMPRAAAPGIPNVTAASGVMKPATMEAIATPFSAAAESFVRSF